MGANYGEIHFDNRALLLVNTEKLLIRAACYLVRLPSLDIIILALMQTGSVTLELNNLKITHAGLHNCWPAFGGLPHAASTIHPILGFSNLLIQLIGVLFFIYIFN